jgi:hypothetical protein
VRGLAPARVFTSTSIHDRTAGTLTLDPYLSDRGDDLLQLYEWYFSAGWWIIHLKNLSPYDTYAMALHQADEVYASRSLDAEMSPGYGDDVWLHVEVQTAGWCCLAVFRPDHSSPNTPAYQLNMYAGVSAAPEAPSLPAVTRLAGASPNPFNPQVTIAFDLAAPARVRLAVYDLQGALVRVLADGDLAAGRSSATWDGRDDSGRALPSGAYFARFDAGGVRESMKVMLVR